MNYERIGIRQKAKGKRQKAKGKRQKAEGRRQKAKGKRVNNIDHVGANGRSSVTFELFLD